MKKLLFLGLALFAAGVALLVLEAQVLRSPEERRLAALTRVQLGATTSLEVPAGVEALERHFRVLRLDVSLEVPDAPAPLDVPAVALNESPWGETITVRTKRSRVTNRYTLEPRLSLTVPADAASAGGTGTLVVDGMLAYPTTPDGGTGFSEEVVRLQRRFDVLFVATAAEMHPPSSAVATTAGVLLVGGLLLLAGTFLLALVRSLRTTGASTQPSFRGVDEVRFAVGQGGRFVCFQYVVSVLVLTFRRGSETYYIPPGGSAFIPGFKWTVLSLALGWWGIPWGPIYTIGALFRNLSGGVDVTDAVLAGMAKSTAGAAATPPPVPPVAPARTNVAQTVPPPLPDEKAPAGAGSSPPPPLPLPAAGAGGPPPLPSGPAAPPPLPSGPAAPPPLPPAPR